LSEANTEDKRTMSRRRTDLSPYNLRFSDWSPGGQMLSIDLFAGWDNPGAVLIMNTQGEELFRTTRGSHARFCGEKWIVFAASTGPFSPRENDIFSLNLSNGRGKNLTESRKRLYYPPAVSSDGKKVAYTFDSLSSSGGIWMMSVDASNKTKLVDGDRDFLDRRLLVISFSPHGSKILFVAAKRREEIGALYSVDVVSGSLIKITDDIVRSGGSASWSPDGRQIVFTSYKDGNDELYIVNVDGTDLRRLTNNTTMDCCPDW
jgi:TolB protein